MVRSGQSSEAQIYKWNKIKQRFGVPPKFEAYVNVAGRRLMMDDAFLQRVLYDSKVLVISWQNLVWPRKLFDLVR